MAFLTAPRRLMADPDRLRHFRRLSRALGLRATVLYSPLTLGDVQQATRIVLAGLDAPTAVITNSDYTAHAVCKAVREMGRALMLRLLGRVPLDDYVAPVELIGGPRCKRPPTARRGLPRPGQTGRPQPVCLGVLPSAEQWLAPARQLGNAP